MTHHHFSISAQIAEVERELKMRRQVYPHQVAKGKLRKSVAEYQTDALQAVLESLQWNRENRAYVIEWIKAGKPKTPPSDYGAGKDHGAEKHALPEAT